MNTLLSNTTTQVKLNDRQQLVAREYIVNGYKITEAYEKYYPEQKKNSAYTSASRLLSSEKFKSYLKQITAEKYSKFDITKDFVIQKFMSLYDKCIDDDDNSNAARALENINKMLGFNAAEKLDITTQQERILNGEVLSLREVFEGINLNTPIKAIEEHKELIEAEVKDSEDKEL